MSIYWLLLGLTAIIAYVFGSMDTLVLASNFVFRRNLLRLGDHSSWLSNFRRLFGIKGFFKLLVVEIIKDLIPADSFKIEMKNPYSPVYMTCIEEAKKDLRAKARPELVSVPGSIDEYDTVILAYPNYWGTMPMAVYTFLESFDFSGKTILPLCTNEGSGMGSSEREIKKTCPGAAVKKGLPITGSAAASSKSSVERWLKANGLI